MTDRPLGEGLGQAVLEGAALGAAGVGLFKVAAKGAQLVQTAKASRKARRAATVADDVAGVSDDVVRRGTGKTVTEMADQVATLAGRNPVSARSAGGRQMDIDLRGKSHFEKPSWQRINTPHVHDSKVNVGRNGQTNLSDRTTRPATPEDVRLARKLMEH